MAKFKKVNFEETTTNFENSSTDRRVQIRPKHFNKQIFGHKWTNTPELVKQELCIF